MEKKNSLNNFLDLGVLLEFIQGTKKAKDFKNDFFILLRRDFTRASAPSPEPENEANIKAWENFFGQGSTKDSIWVELSNIQKTEFTEFIKRYPLISKKISKPIKEKIASHETIFTMFLEMIQIADIEDEDFALKFSLKDLKDCCPDFLELTYDDFSTSNDSYKKIYIFIECMLICSSTVVFFFDFLTNDLQVKKEYIENEYTNLVINVLETFKLKNKNENYHTKKLISFMKKFKIQMEKMFESVKENQRSIDNLRKNINKCELYQNKNLNRLNKILKEILTEPIRKNIDFYLKAFNIDDLSKIKYPIGLLDRVSTCFHIFSEIFEKAPQFLKLSNCKQEYEETIRFLLDHNEKGFLAAFKTSFENVDFFLLDAPYTKIEFLSQDIIEEYRKTDIVQYLKTIVTDADDKIEKKLLLFLNGESIEKNDYSFSFEIHGCIFDKELRKIIDIMDKSIIPLNFRFFYTRIFQLMGISIWTKIKVNLSSNFVSSKRTNFAVNWNYLLALIWSKLSDIEIRDERQIEFLEISLFLHNYVKKMIELADNTHTQISKDLYLVLFKDLKKSVKDIYSKNKKFENIAIEFEFKNLFNDWRTTAEDKRKTRHLKEAAKTKKDNRDMVDDVDATLSDQEQENQNDGLNDYLLHRGY